MLDHFHTMMLNQTGFTGALSGANNYKDTAKNLGITQAKISQTADDLLTPMYLSRSTSREFLHSLRFGNNEYIKFKNKFISLKNFTVQHQFFANQNRTVDYELNSRNYNLFNAVINIIF